jgi:hypothetical protein
MDLPREQRTAEHLRRIAHMSTACRTPHCVCLFGECHPR